MTFYSEYFTKFPRIKYDINHTVPGKNLETVMDIFFRFGYIREVLNNTTSYYSLMLEDGDTPELLAEKVYGDSNAGWMIILANQILDPQFDWPMDYDTFQKYIISKYGSIQNAQQGIHHYEMVVTRTYNPDAENIVSEYRYVVDAGQLTENDLDVPYNYYDLGNDQLARTQEYATYNINGQTVTEIIDGDAITYYDYEDALNQNRRYVKVVKAEYYHQIMNEFDNLIKNSRLTK